jgi:hypothetical protein
MKKVQWYKVLGINKNNERALVLLEKKKKEKY